jgi:hypothetical protein
MSFYTRFVYVQPATLRIRPGPIFSTGSKDRIFINMMPLFFLHRYVQNDTHHALFTFL